MEVKDIKTILEEWRLSHLIECFDEHGIDTEAFTCLTDELIKELISKIGDRAKFIKEYNQMYRATINIGASTSANVGDLEIQYLDTDHSSFSLSPQSFATTVSAGTSSSSHSVQAELEGNLDFFNDEPLDFQIMAHRNASDRLKTRQPRHLSVPPKVNRPNSVRKYSNQPNPTQNASSGSGHQNELLAPDVSQSRSSQIGTWRNNPSQRHPTQITSSEQQQRRSKKRIWIGFDKLEKWSNMEPDDILVELIGGKTGFNALLESDLMGDNVVLVAKILAKLCLSPFKENKNEIMNLVSKEKFLYNLKSYVMQLQLQQRHERKENKLFWEDVDGFFVTLITMFESIIESLPTKACEILPKMLKAITITVPVFEAEQIVEISSEIKQKFEKVQEKLNLCKSEVERKRQSVAQQREDRPPPDDFRELSVFPTIQEILLNYRPFLRKHIIEGTYKNVDHYLDVQFRLLKEDFVAPLREAVCEFMRQTQTKNYTVKISNIRIHPNVEFLQPWYDNGRVGVLLQLSNQTKKYQNSKRFMYGSLVCFTKDNFSTALIFGRIIEKNTKLEQENRVVIGFEQEYQNAYELNRPYLMVECSVYFEPYYHVLKALQTMREEDFPMKNYLVDVNPNVEPPNYLNPESIYNINNNAVSVLNPDSWPSSEDLNLDDTQYSAFKAALTQKFAVIQGPPGTGKTYLGLEVAKTLIRNGHCWYNRTPILVVCFTNHALDQFLEGLVSTTSEIVRVGGQSKNEKLEPFNLKEKRKVLAREKVQTAIYNIREELGEVLNSIKSCSESLAEIQKYEGVVEFKQFNGIDPEYQASWFNTASDGAIGAWLLGGRTHQPENPKVSTAGVEEVKKMENCENNLNILNMETPMGLHEMLQAANRSQYMVDEDVELVEMLSNAPKKPTYLISVSKMEDNVNEIWKDTCKLTRDPQGAHKNKKHLERELFNAEEDLEYLKMRLGNAKNIRVTKKPVKLDLTKPQNMNPDDRWALYFYWLHQYRTFLINQLVAFQAIYHEKYNQYTEIKNIGDTEVMKQMLVVGMTTTSAARLQTTLQSLQNRIVIVEEAAEVLESHIVVSLTTHCEHLILIGDHQQLRPSTASFRTEKYFNLGISLFERMVRNKIQCHVLGVQHRMRPEIAKLIVPNIYPILEDHPSVCNFPPILGVDPCLYFIDHDHPEEESGESSKLNKHEARFLIRLARYLVQNGYRPTEITILAAYSGQMFALWEERNKNPILIEDVRITVLDNYQGEESKIILLSLVRNNGDDKIGFLKIENRVCVALSRAKEGFYMMGNMDLLCRNSEIWPKVKISLESQDCLGKSLVLRCQFHKEEVLRVNSAEDFEKVAEGGCRKVCGVTLSCGHKCTQICHFTDRAHASIICRESCTRILCEDEHVCPKQCYQDCGDCIVLMERNLPCGHCEVLECHINPDEYICRRPVTVQLPCGHEQDIECHINQTEYKCQIPVTAELPCGHTVTNKPCYKKPKYYKCPFPCDTTVEPCGHACTLKCHIQDDPDHLEYRCPKPCVKLQAGCSTGEHICPKSCFEECRPCLVIVKKFRTVCSHSLDAPCNVNVDEADCPKPCKIVLPCGHQCNKKCYEECGNCNYVVEKLLPDCHHTVKTNCCETPNPKVCRSQCPKKQSCGHPCKNRCNEPCTAKCKELVDHRMPADCGHKFKIHCYMLTQELPSYSSSLLQFCQEPCGVVLACSHPCSGTCRGCTQRRFHEICKEKCGVPLICGHQCPLLCRDTCQPCNQNCLYKCKHGACKNKCGDPCTSCKENCERQCKHVHCTAKCGYICTVPPCIEPCEEPLQCGHPCIGFCGDPCPPLCRICDYTGLIEIFPGLEDEESVRFVLLDECKHVVESIGMEKWLQEGVGIKYKSCPKCKTPLRSTKRYSDYIKQVNKDVAAVKRKCLGTFKENEKLRSELLERLTGLQANCLPLLNYSPGIRTLLENLKTSLSHVRNKKRQLLSIVVADTCTLKIQIIEFLVATFTEAKLRNVEVVGKAFLSVNFMVNFLLQQKHEFTEQEIIDIQRELKRFERIIQLCRIEDYVKLQSTTADKPNVQELLENANKLTLSVKPYTKYADIYLKQKLVDLSKEIEAGIGIKNGKRQQLVKSKGMKPESWFKCPNGHIYYVDDFGGGAAAITKCNQCSTAMGNLNRPKCANGSE